jgi:hypothetical protein
MRCQEQVEQAKQDQVNRFGLLKKRRSFWAQARNKGQQKGDDAR